MKTKISKHLSDFRKVHGDRYEYDVSSITNTRTKMRIKCLIHGWFEQTPANHKAGRGCHKCSIIKKSKSPDSILEKFHDVHGDTYEYDFGSFTKVHSHMRIRCSFHGWFEQTPSHHMGGSGCPVCGGSKKFTNAERILSFRKVHGDKYEYDISSMVGSHVCMRIKCSTHGWFEQTPANHTRGCGCPKCGGNVKDDISVVIAEFHAIHNHKYEYDIETFTGDNVRIKCPTHGWFWQTLDTHRRGSGCTKCYMDSKTLSITVLRDSFHDIHGDKYEYDFLSFKNVNTKMRIKCPEHGWFNQLPALHKKGCDCPICARIALIIKPDELLLSFRKVHGVKYEYDDASITDNSSLVRIKCPEHGWFYQKCLIHKNGSGCPKCVHMGPSNEEDAVAAYVSSICDAEIIRSDRKVLNGKELDIYIPTKNLAIEYCGLYWHGEKIGKSKNYHKEKYDICKQHGIHLITIFSDEWMQHPEKVKSAINAIIGNRKKGAAARKCTVGQVPASIANAFYDQYHLQGGGVRGLHYALLDDTSIVAMMTFGHPQRKSKWEWELHRFVTDYIGHIGAAGKLLKSFQREHNFPSIVSFSDRRWFDGHMYATLGFTHDGEIPPDYSYVHNNVRFHKSAFRKSSIRVKFPDIYNAALTENLMMIEAGYDRIYDCGKDRWVIK